MVAHRSTSNVHFTCRSVVLLAREKFPTKYVRIQPKPNVSGSDVYQLHCRPKRPLTLSDFDWHLIGQGTLNNLGNFVSVLQVEVEGGASRSYVVQ